MSVLTSYENNAFPCLNHFCILLVERVWTPANKGDKCDVTTE